ncbi:hypothetical protein GOQ29_13050 [Clostridium sp. D2Q-14]|uniref:hypothetical protein n=1 Tax=Anaeromonas gelatinilytica TaxID=2683194 RepID=UPI00193C791F|nr:hypothetical protein [Anaeromonas gelatinilytica]MBS4536546.1 hypothetical protein [Anaeromonas gelatinilytica]
MKKIDVYAKIIRILTIAPIMALCALSILYRLCPDIFIGYFDYIASIIFLTVLPISAYPLQPFIPKFCFKGREGQRNLAIIMGVLGYLFSIVFALYFNVSKELLIIYLVYFISGIGIVLFNRILKIRASGHACGIVGPISILVYFIGLKALLGVIIVLLVYWASLKIKRHTVSQLFWGSLIPICSLIIAVLYVN